jgi:hypothetical protein
MAMISGGEAHTNAALVRADVLVVALRQAIRNARGTGDCRTDAARSARDERALTRVFRILLRHICVLYFWGRAALAREARDRDVGFMLRSSP